MVALLVLGLLLSFLKMYVEMRLYLLRLHHTCQGDERNDIRMVMKGQMRFFRPENTEKNI